MPLADMEMELMDGIICPLQTKSNQYTELNGRISNRDGMPCC